MFGNLISFLVLLASVVLFGWLTYRAWKAVRWIVRWPGLVASGLLTLLAAVVTFFAVKGLAFMYIAPGPAPDISVEGTPEQIARGAYLAGVACIGCHGADDGSRFPLSGGQDVTEDIPLPIGTMVISNITPGGVLAHRTDGELFRVIRHGYGKGKRAAAMTFMPFGSLSDEDIEAIIAFLRSQESVTTETVGGDDLNILGAVLLFGANLVPLPETIDGPVTAPPMGANPEYGKYVANIGECRSCHGPDMTGSEATPFSPAYPNPRPLVATLTLEQFTERMRTGKRPDGSELDMPWRNAAAMSDDDLAALYAYLIEPVK
ncbi:MAG: c-type cytochrome [Gemmatimonadota bacterium]